MYIELNYKPKIGMPGLVTTWAVLLLL
jgi:hypothetical protein